MWEAFPRGYINQIYGDNEITRVNEQKRSLPMGDVKFITYQKVISNDSAKNANVKPT